MCGEKGLLEENRNGNDAKNGSLAGFLGLTMQSVITSWISQRYIVSGDSFSL